MHVQCTTCLINNLSLNMTENWVNTANTGEWQQPPHSLVKELVNSTIQIHKPDSDDWRLFCEVVTAQKPIKHKHLKRILSKHQHITLAVKSPQNPAMLKSVMCFTVVMQQLALRCFLWCASSRALMEPRCHSTLMCILTCTDDVHMDACTLTRLLGLMMSKRHDDHTKQ